MLGERYVKEGKETINKIWIMLGSISSVKLHNFFVLFYTLFLAFVHFLLAHLLISNTLQNKKYVNLVSNRLQKKTFSENRKSRPLLPKWSIQTSTELKRRIYLNLTTTQSERMCTGSVGGNWSGAGSLLFNTSGVRPRCRYAQTDTMYYYYKMHTRASDSTYRGGNRRFLFWCSRTTKRRLRDCDEKCAVYSHLNILSVVKRG